MCTEAAAKLQQHKEQCTQLLDAHVPEDNMIETLEQRIQDIKVHECVSAAWYKPGLNFETQIKRTPSSPVVPQIQLVENIKSVGFFPLTDIFVFPLNTLTRS